MKLKWTIAAIFIMSNHSLAASDDAFKFTELNNKTFILNGDSCVIPDPNHVDRDLVNVEFRNAFVRGGISRRSGGIINLGDIDEIIVIERANPNNNIPGKLKATMADGSKKEFSFFAGNCLFDCVGQKRDNSITTRGYGVWAGQGIENLPCGNTFVSMHRIPRAQFQAMLKTIEKEKSANREAFQTKMTIGDSTNCGMIINTRDKILVEVQTKNGNKWFKRTNLDLPGKTPCLD
jgi:hypothetical protein